MRRRTVLAGVAAGLLTTGGCGAWRPEPGETLTRVRSAARGRTVDFWTAVPQGHGDGRGLPVCLVLHGGSKTAADFPALGLARALTTAVRAGAEPFALAGATGDRLAWRPNGADDPQRMVHEEIPAWCATRGFDTSRLAAWGWSMGGYGSLLLAETFPGFVRAVAAFSPAISPADDVCTGIGRLGGLPIGLWCGRQDGLLDTVRAFGQALPYGPAAGSYTDGRHNFGYWATVIPQAFRFVAAQLAAGAPSGTPGSAPTPADSPDRPD